MSKPHPANFELRGQLPAVDEDGKPYKPGDFVWVKARCRVVQVVHDEGCEPVAAIRNDGKFKVERWQ